MTELLAVVLAYLLGSVSFAVVVSRLSGLADPRSYGSGNPGATNVLRTGNKTAAVFTLLGDTLKGVFAVWSARHAGLDEAWVNLAGLAVFFGHLYPVFLKFKGGKGVATGGGVLLAVSPVLGLGALATWIVVAMTTRYSSLAALLAALSAPFWGLVSEGMNIPTFTATVIGVSLLARHLGNIRRLLSGQETRIGDKKHGTHPKSHRHSS